MALSGGALSPIGDRRGGTFFFPVEPATFDQVAVDPSVRLLRGAWTRGFLSYLASLVSADGTLRIPVYSHADGAKGRLTVQECQAAIGISPQVRQAPARQLNMPTTAKAKIGRGFESRTYSTLNWYLDHAAEILSANAEASGRPDVAEAFSRLPRRLGIGDAVPDPDEDALGLLHQQAYYVGGIAYKAPLMSFIINQLMGHRNELAIIDVGGGYGLLAAELILDDDVPVTRASVVDHSSVNEALSKPLQQWLSATGCAPFEFTRYAVEECPGFPDVDVMTAIGTLLYVPRDRLRDVLARMWTALRPGGILVVHENIKAPSYVRDFDLMFEPGELDSYLEPFGSIRYFASTAMMELDPLRVGRSSVFRAVHKDD